MTAKKRVAVVGVDFAPTGDDAIVECLRLIRAGAVDRVHLLHVVDPKEVVDDAERGVLEFEADSLRRAPDLLEERVLDLARLAGFAVSRDQFKGHARIGNPAETLLQMCVDYEADLLVVGTHGRRGLDRFLLGSVAEALVRRASCPVLIARPKNYHGLEKTKLPDQPYRPGEAPSIAREQDVHIQASTTIDAWKPADNGPTGFRIV